MAPEVDLVGVLRLTEILKAGQVVLEKTNAHNTSSSGIGEQSCTKCNFGLTSLGKVVPIQHVILRRCGIATDLKKSVHGIVLGVVGSW